MDGPNSIPSSGKILATVAEDGSTDLFNQVTNEGLSGKSVGLSLQGVAGEREFMMKFVPFRIPQSARTFVDPSKEVRKNKNEDHYCRHTDATDSRRMGAEP